MVSRPFSAFEKESLEIAGRLILADAPDHAAGVKQTYVNDMQAKWCGHGRMTSSCTLLSTVSASAQL